MLKSIKGEYYRIVLEIYPPLSTSGAEARGGRWNKPGEPALYLSFSKKGAAREVVKHYLEKTFKIPLKTCNRESIEKIRLKVPRELWKDVQQTRFRVVRIECEVENVLNVGEEKTRKKLGIDIEKLTGSQEITRKLIQTLKTKFKLEGIIYPSSLNPKEKHLCILDKKVLKSGKIKKKSSTRVSFSELISLLE
ncbi:MAG: hypothetical protein DRJ11_09655 [Candidatus Aminicenantes bacterium]|nr:MAG: hypothetical protein DRJ11_09655 [Candidatus Aminicenantes bacterium]